MSHARSPAVFATAQFSQMRLDAGDSVAEPASVAHAKTMGATSTLCGLSALTWFKFWSLPYHAVGGPRCADCDDVLRSAAASSS